MGDNIRHGGNRNALTGRSAGWWWYEQLDWVHCGHDVDKVHDVGKRRWFPGDEPIGVKDDHGREFVFNQVPLACDGILVEEVGAVLKDLEGRHTVDLQIQVQGRGCGTNGQSVDVVAREVEEGTVLLIEGYCCIIVSV